MFKNAFAYVTRKSLKSLVILLVILAMSTLSLIGLSISRATDKASEETFGTITNSFSMEINRQVNQDSVMSLEKENAELKLNINELEKRLKELEKTEHHEILEK